MCDIMRRCLIKGKEVYGGCQGGGGVGDQAS